MSVPNQTVPARFIKLKSADSPEKAFAAFNDWITRNVTPKDLALVKIYDKDDHWQFAVTVHAIKHKVFLHVVVPKTDDYIIAQCLIKEKLRSSVKAAMSKEEKKGDIVDDDEESNCVSYSTREHET